MFERFTGDARQVVVLAQEQARDLGHNYIGTEHLLLAVVCLPAEVEVRRALFELGVSPDVVRAAVGQIVGCDSSTKPVKGNIPFTPRAKKVLELSLREALRLRCNYIGPEHIVLGILREGAGVAAQILAQEGRSFDEIRAAVTSDVPPVGGSADLRTPAAEQVLSLAERLAAGAPVGSHHLLEALARIDKGMGAKALAGLGVTADAITGQVDALDLTETDDVTPEQAAAATMRWEVGADSATLTTADPLTVERLRRITEQTGGELSGNGPLAGPFIALHQAIRHAVEAFDGALGPAPEDDSPPATLRERLRRRRRP
ncbi:MAG: Clp protease N-terminal domain-containing protein [Pseudonocardia sp.]